MKFVSSEDILDYEIESFSKDYSDVLHKHAILLQKISSSDKAKKKLKQELLSLIISLN